MSITILKSGPLTTVQDLGRPGMAHIGVPPSGALDRGALRRANALVGNDEACAALEATLIGPSVRFDADTTFALTGAITPATMDGEPVAYETAVAAAAGQTLVVGQATTGMRSYLAVSGGIDCAQELGSRATDTLTGLGPAPLRDGDVLPLGHDRRVPSAPQAGANGTQPGLIELILGPRAQLFSDEAIAALASAAFTVTPQSNRVGLRLTGPALSLREQAELPSEGMVTGALQVPPSGEPILMLADHPTTGGYPVIAVATERSLDVAAQLRPGAEVRFSVS